MSIASTLGAYRDAWAAGDLARIVDAYHDDFVLHYFGTSPLAGTHTGKQAALTVLAQATQRSARELVEIQDVLAGERLGALVAVERLGPERREVRRLLLYTVRDDKLAECWLYDEDQPFVDALWRDGTG
jgi:ketosteroid isomerase-like protein